MRPTIVMILVAATVLATVVAAQQVRRTETGTVTADLIEYDFAHNDFKATGNVRVSIAGRHKAELTAPSLAMDLNDNLDRIIKLTATGPVTLNVLTAPDSEGLRRRIVASCSSRATYDAGSETIILTGNVKTDITTLPEGHAEAAHFTGQSVTVNLRNSTLSVKQAEVSVTTEVNTNGDE